jgi:hypothetical protein
VNIEEGGEGKKKGRKREKSERWGGGDRKRERGMSLQD